jgi:flavin-binding protein dodecin
LCEEWWGRHRDVAKMVELVGSSSASSDGAVKDAPAEVLKTLVESAE